MAENGRREVVGDPLALNPASQMADRSLATIGVRNPGKSGGQDEIYANRMGLLDSMGNLANAVNKVIETKADEWQTEGKLAFMQGQTEQQIASTGNKYTMQGWQSMAAVEAANNWYATELTNIENGGYNMDPGTYGKTLMDRRADFLKNLPDDPAVRKVYAAAFDDLGTRLTAQHTEAHNKYNIQQTENSFVGMLTSGSQTNSDVSRVIPGGTPLAMSGSVVRQTVQYNDNDVDVLTRTILGEAGGEGPTGMAAVAHVIVNRAIDGGYGGKSIAGVAQSPQQFSTWNKGAGGNNPGRFDPGSQGYQQARNIAMAVLSGHHIDPTNGATHFFSQAGMDKLVRDGHQTNRTPAWWNDQVGRSGGSITIGGHQFAGRANGTGGAPFTGGRNLARGGGVLKFRHAGQEALQESFSGILVDASNALGRDLTITSGYRSPERNASVGGAGQSRHMHGDAADIDMKGMSPNERAELVQTLRAKGVRRFGTYDNHPDMLHVDMSEANGQNWFMHNKSNGNMASAPAWFKQVAASPIPSIDPNTTAGPGASGASGTEVNAAPTLQAEPYSGPSTQVQAQIRNDPMPAPRKGELVGQSMFTQLQGGDDSLFREAGGIAMLQELGAPQSVIRQVQAAKEAFDKEKLNRFDVEKLKWENDIVLQVGSGDVSAEDALNQVNARHSQNLMTDEQARSLAGRVMQQSASLGKQPNMSFELMDGMSRIFASVNALTLDPKDADQQIRDLAQVHDVPVQQLNQFIGRMWSEQEQGLNAQRTAIQRADAKRIEQDGRKDMVRHAIATGTGLGTLSGVGSIDGTDRATGNSRSFSPVQWGIEQIKDQEIAAAKSVAEQAVAGGMDPREADAMATSQMYTNIYTALRKQGVVDEDFKADLTGALIGNIIETGGAIDARATAAFDLYLQLSKNPEIGESYMASYFGDTQAQQLAENAAQFYNGAEFGIEQSLRKAHEMLDPSKYNPQDRINADVRFNNVVDAQVKENIAKITNSESWLASAWSYAPNGLSDPDIAAARENDGQLRTMIERRARTLHVMAGGQEHPDVVIKRAANEVLKDAYIVGGNFVMPMDKNAPTIMEALGLQGESKDLPNRLISDYVFNEWISARRERAETGNDPTALARVEIPLNIHASAAWNAAERAKIENTGMSYTEWRRHNPQGSMAFHAEYLPNADPTKAMVRVRLWQDASRTEFSAADPIMIPLRELGDSYKEKEVLMQEDDGPGPFQRFMNWVTE